MRQAGRHVTRLYDEALAPVGLSLNQYSILSKLSQFGPLTIRALSHRLVMDRSTLGHLLRPLERDGWLAIGNAEADKRQRLIALTPAGDEILRGARTLWAGVEQRFELALGPESARQMRTLMRQITELRLDST